MGNIVAIVGRPNVGKSTLFNRLTQSRQAIVNEQAGTTRDRQYGKVQWQDKEFSLIDTGGWVVNSEDVFEEEINKQVKVAIEEADVILFVVDVVNGLTDLDSDVAAILRRGRKPVIIVANKADNFEELFRAAKNKMREPIKSALFGCGHTRMSVCRSKIEIGLFYKRRFDESLRQQLLFAAVGKLARKIFGRAVLFYGSQRLHQHFHKAQRAL